MNKDVWTVIRHPGRGGDTKWHTLLMWSGDVGEIRAKKKFNSVSKKLKNGIVVLTRNGTIVNHTGPGLDSGIPENCVVPETSRTNQKN